MRQALRVALRTGGGPVASVSSIPHRNVLLAGSARLSELHTRQLACSASWRNPFGGQLTTEAVWERSAQRCTVGTNPQFVVHAV